MEFHYNIGGVNKNLERLVWIIPENPDGVVGRWHALIFIV